MQRDPGSNPGGGKNLLKKPTCFAPDLLWSFLFEQKVFSVMAQQAMISLQRMEDERLFRD